MGSEIGGEMAKNLLNRLTLLESTRHSDEAEIYRAMTDEELSTLLAGGTIAATQEELLRRPRPTWAGKRVADMTDDELLEVAR